MIRYNWCRAVMEPYVTGEDQRVNLIMGLKGLPADRVAAIRQAMEAIASLDDAEVAPFLQRFREGREASFR